MIIPTGKLRLVSNSQVLVMGLNNSTAVIVSPFWSMPKVGFGN